MNEEQKKQPRMWVYVLVGALIGATIPAFMLGLFHMDTSYIGSPFAPVIFGALAGWALCKRKGRRADG